MSEGSSDSQSEIGKSVLDPSHSHHSYQSTLDVFLPTLQNQKDFPFDLETFVEKVVSKVVQKLNNSGKEKKSAASFNPSPTTSINARNLLECLDEVPEFELVLEENSRILRCCSCVEFLPCPISFSSAFRRPSGKAAGSLAAGLQLSDEVYEQLVAGRCDKWYHPERGHDQTSCIQHTQQR